MRIIHITEAFQSGVIEFLRSLTTASPDIDYTIIYGRTSNYDIHGKTFPPSVKFIPWPSVVTSISPAKDAKALRELISILKAEKPFDIMHLHSSKAGILGRLAATAIGHKKVIYAPHGAAFLRKDISRLTRTFYITAEKAVNIFPGKVVGVSKSEADTYNKIGIRAGFVNNGKDFAAPPEKNLQPERFIIVTTGRIETQKNATWFNTIAKRFADDERVQFVWIGEGVDRHMLTSKNIHITGYVLRPEVEKNLFEASIYLSTAIWEGLPYAVLEAMSMKLPLLLSHCPGNTDVTQHGVNGFLFKQTDEAVGFIKQYLDNPDLVARQGEASFNILQTDFSAQQMQLGYRKLYGDMIDKKRSFSNK